MPIARTEGLMLFRHSFHAEQMARFPRLRVVVRMGVGYDRIDRAEAARRGITVCNCPDYGTTEVADHAVALAMMTLRRGVLLHHEAQRRTPAAWRPIDDPPGSPPVVPDRRDRRPGADRHRRRVALQGVRLPRRVLRSLFGERG